MNLIPREAQELAEIERQLTKTNPTLATWLTSFRIDPSPAPDPSPPTEPQRMWGGLIGVLIALVVSLAAGVAVVLATV